MVIGMVPLITMLYHMHDNWLIRLSRARGPLSLLAPPVDALSVIDDFHFSYT